MSPCHGRRKLARQPADAARNPVSNLACRRGTPRAPIPTLCRAVVCSSSGCAAKLREIPAHSLSKRTPAVVERDTRQCEKAVTGHLKGPWLGGELEFAACMIARNYQTFVQVLDAPLEVRKASVRNSVSRARVLTDLMECEYIVSGHVSLLEKIGRPAVVVVGMLFFPIGFGSTTMSPALAIQRQHDYSACMEPRGYVVSRWKPDPSPPLPKSGQGP